MEQSPAIQPKRNAWRRVRFILPFWPLLLSGSALAFYYLPPLVHAFDGHLAESRPVILMALVCIQMMLTTLFRIDSKTLLPWLRLRPVWWRLSIAALAVLFGAPSLALLLIFFTTPDANLVLYLTGVGLLGVILLVIVFAFSTRLVAQLKNQQALQDHSDV